MKGEVAPPTTPRVGGTGSGLPRPRARAGSVPRGTGRAGGSDVLTRGGWGHPRSQYKKAPNADGVGGKEQSLALRRELLLLGGLLLHGFLLLEEDRLGVGLQVGDDLVSGVEAAEEHLFCQRVFDEPLHRAP